MMVFVSRFFLAFVSFTSIFNFTEKLHTKHTSIQFSPWFRYFRTERMGLVGCFTISLRIVGLTMMKSTK